MVKADIDPLWRARLICLFGMRGEGVVSDWPESLDAGSLFVNGHVLSPHLFCSFGINLHLQGHWAACLTIETGVAEFLCQGGELCQ